MWARCVPKAVSEACLRRSFNAGAQLEPDSAVTLALYWSSEAEIQRLVAARAEDDQILRHPLPDFWDGSVGALADKYWAVLKAGLR